MASATPPAVADAVSAASGPGTRTQKQPIDRSSLDFTHLAREQHLARLVPWADAALQAGASL